MNEIKVDIFVRPSFYCITRTVPPFSIIIVLVLIS